MKLFKYNWFLCWAGCLIFVIGSALIPAGGEGTPGRDLPIDKIAHFILFFILCMVPVARMPQRRIAYIVGALMPVMGFALEYLQQNIGGRNFSPEDMIARNAGALIGILIGTVIRMRKRVDKLETEYKE